MSTRPLAAAVATIWSASATVRQSGFSQATCLPARSSASVSADVMGGRRGHEGDLDVVVARQLADRRVRAHAGKSASAAFRRSRFGSTTATSSSPSVRVTPMPW